MAQAAGFSLHAGVVAIERLSLTAQGHVRYALKSPYRDGTTHVIFEPLERAHHRSDPAASSIDPVVAPGA